MHPLDIEFSRPLEREYEAWIIHGIEQYFKCLGEKVAVWAVSPKDEVIWPADERLVVGRKLIGLQLKKVEYEDRAKALKEFGRLTWKFHSPPGQFDLVSKFSEIYYCLPTFVNRNYREQALHHCLFWRPEHSVVRDLNAWYDNDGAHTPHKSIGHAPRWGYFIEKVLNCSIGKKVESIEDAKNYLNTIRGQMRELEALEKSDASENKDSPSSEYDLLLLALPMLND